MLAAIAVRFQSLGSVRSIDHAQLARHLAQGDGWVTSIIRPVSLRYKAQYASHPDLYNAPLHPLVESLVYRWLGATDRITAAVGACLWILSVWLTFLIASRWLGTGVAALATVFYIGNAALISAATNGLSSPLLAILVLVTIGLALPELKSPGLSAWSSKPTSSEPPPDSQEGSTSENDAVEEDASEESAAPEATTAPETYLLPQLPPWRLGVVGLVCGLAVLSHYLMIVMALVVGVYVITSQANRKSALIALLIGFLIPLLPWMARNYQTVGSPFFSLYWYEILARTTTYPGDSFWRTLDAPPHPLGFMVLHPADMMRKLSTSFTLFRNSLLDVTGPMIAFLFLAAWLSGQGSRPWRRLVTMTAVSLMLCVFASGFLRPNHLLAFAWHPLIAIIAAAYLAEALQARVPRFALGKLRIRPRMARALAYIGVILLAIAPVFHFIAVERSRPAESPDRVFEVVKEQVAEDGVVISDQPGLVAWYGSRNALWLVQKEKDWAELEDKVAPIDASYTTNSINLLGEGEKRQWWGWLVNPRGAYRTLRPADQQPVSGVLKLRRKEATR